MMMTPPRAHADEIASPAHEALFALFEEERQTAWRENPLGATYDGVHDYDDRLPSVTPADFARQLAQEEAFLARLDAIDRSALSHQDQISYDLFHFILAENVELGQFRSWRVPINSDSGFYADILLLASAHEFRDVEDYENYIARLNDIPRYFDENIANMRVGLADGFTLPREILDPIAGVIAGAQIESAEQSTFWAPFEDFPDMIPAAQQRRLTQQGRRAIERSVKPAYANFQRFFTEEYIPGARTTLGASAMPEGEDYYAALVRYFTTLPDATPQQVHEIGLQEVARIRAQMEAIIEEVGFEGSFADFLQFLRTDPQFYPTTPEELLYKAAWITREIDEQMPEYFGRIPRTPYTVKPVPAALAPNYTAGRYNPGPVGAAGQYWVNTTSLDQRPFYALPALTLHEAAPGHHTQGSLARELEGVPEFRLNFYPHAFGEGWGLYSEYLGEEMGIYQTPYEWFGRYTYEMWRACRLVVDTGMHSMGWTREQALEYLASNTALSELEVRTEIDRYIAWPGQALAYKMGEMRIKELRARAEAALGADFDVRTFHDTVLGSGGLTLPVLEQEIDRYIAAAQE